MADATDPQDRGRLDHGGMVIRPRVIHPLRPGQTGSVRMTDGAGPGSGIGLGLAAVARPAYITSGRDTDLGSQRSIDDLRRRSHALLDAAYTAGVRYVDVARSYGRAEEFLAQWLATRPDVDDVVVGSKWGYRYVGGWRLDADVHEVKDHSASAFEEQVAQTRALLGDRLSIYHVHSVTTDSPALTDIGLHRRLASPSRRWRPRSGSRRPGPPRSRPCAARSR